MSAHLQQSSPRGSFHAARVSFQSIEGIQGFFLIIIRRPGLQLHCFFFKVGKYRTSAIILQSTGKVVLFCHRVSILRTFEVGTKMTTGFHIQSARKAGISAAGFHIQSMVE